REFVEPSGCDWEWERRRAESAQRQSRHPPPAEEFASEGNLLGKGTREVRLIYTFLLVAFLMAQIGIAQSTPDQKPAAPAPATAPATTAPPTTTPAPDNTAAPEQPEKKGILHKLNPLHRGGGKAKAEKPAKPEKPAAPEKAASASENPEATGPTAFVQVEGNHSNM